jgi:hypothetical protein
LSTKTEIQNLFNADSDVLSSERAIQVNMQVRLLNNVWYFNCRKTTGIGGDVSGKVSRDMMVLHGMCACCEGQVARLIENE